MEKYITTALEKGQLHYFTELVVDPVELPESTTFCIFYDEEKDCAKEKAVALARRMVSLQERRGGSGVVGPEDWLWFKEQPQSLYHSERPLDAVRATFIKFALKGNVEEAIRNAIDYTRVWDLTIGGKVALVNSKKGYLMRPGRTPFLCLYSCDPSLFKNALLHSRSDHDGYRWWTTWWYDAKDNDYREDINREASDVTCEVLRMFPDGLNQISRLFNSPSGIEKISDTEGNLYYKGEAANYHIRIINRPGDYNVYVTAYKKPVI